MNKEVTLSKHYAGETNDCVVRAISSALDITYGEAHEFSKNTYNRQYRNGVLFPHLQRVNDNFSKTKEVVFGKTFTEIVYEPVTVKRIQRETLYTDGYTYDKTLTLYSQKNNKYSQMTTGSFLRKYQKGTFLISVRGHLFTIKDGVIFGNTNDSNERVRILKVWEIK